MGGGREKTGKEMMQMGRQNDKLPRRSPEPYVIGVDVPGHVAVGDELSVDVAADLTVAPAIVDVDDADHVPLQTRDKQDERESLIYHSLLEESATNLFCKRLGYIS